MERNEVYKLIDAEREYQQLMGKSDEHPFEDWLLIMDEYLSEAMDLAQDGFPAEAEEKLLAVVAVGVAAIEQYGCTPRATD